MAKAPNEKIGQAKKLYEKGMKLVEVARQLDVPAGTVRRWKSINNWDGERSDKKASVQKKESTKQKKQKAIAPEVESVIENDKLNDRQRLFCLYFSKSFNATRSYQKAYGCDYLIANTAGPRLLVNVRIKDEILKLRQARYSKAFLGTEDIFQRYIDIAYSDITDYLCFGRREVPVVGAYGPITIKDANDNEIPLMKEINVVEFNQSTEVDGMLICEVSQGKDGVKVKLENRMKALQWLSDHMELSTIEQQARIDKIKIEINRMSGEDEEVESDGFLEALSGMIDIVWKEE